jgi:hypothetical protein
MKENVEKFLSDADEEATRQKSFNAKFVIKGNRLLTLITLQNSTGDFFSFMIC